ncbi:MAG TPA: tetratricopeptide repeat protein [Thermoanaerobaculia bacterium]|nr:tetratricopeptide repeat protein [Thermoanaerobaculia bacterium]
MRIAPLLLLAALPWSWRPHLPAWAERWLYNPRERTEQTIEAWREGDSARAVAAAETANRLAPEDPLTGYNAGTANLSAGRARRAAKILDQAVKIAPPELAPNAWYNLGNARLAAGDPAAAVEAYKQTLLRNPTDAEAKHNLEIALREREQQRLRARGGRQGSRGDRPGEKEQSRKPGEGSPSEDQNRNAPQDPGRGQQGQQQSRGQQGQQNQPSQQGGGRLPDFQNQPEMSSREAANLLSAVEDLERRQRREQAAKRSRQKALKGKDW